MASERVYTAISRPWLADRQRTYLRSLSAREAVHFAETARDGIVGYQTLELWAPALDSMAHVGQIGTFLKSERRRRGIGEALLQNTVEFARKRDFRKFVIQVRASNGSAQRFYERMGFHHCGRLTRQVRIDDRDEDEILMEIFP